MNSLKVYAFLLSIIFCLGSKTLFANENVSDSKKNIGCKNSIKSLKMQDCADKTLEENASCQNEFINSSSSSTTDNLCVSQRRNKKMKVDLESKNSQSNDMRSNDMKSKNMKSKDMRSNNMRSKNMQSSGTKPTESNTIKAINPSQ